MAELNPSLPRLARDNRRFLCAAAALAAVGAGQRVAGTGGVPYGRPAYPLVAAAVKTGD